MLQQHTTILFDKIQSLDKTGIEIVEGQHTHTHIHMCLFKKVTYLTGCHTLSFNGETLIKGQREKMSS